LLAQRDLEDQRVRARAVREGLMELCRQLAAAERDFMYMGWEDAALYRMLHEPTYVSPYQSKAATGGHQPSEHSPVL
jgi:hypothetical protein